jgi:hypothetical protein
VCTGFRWGNLRDRGHWGDADVDEKIIKRWIFRKWDAEVWIGSFWRRIVTSGRAL